jgi:GT2 family glycosyltransferase
MKAKLSMSRENMKPKFSVILNAYDTNKAQRHMSMACLAAIRKFTDMPYEIIVVDNAKQWDIRDEYKVLNLDKVIETPLNTVYESYNIGAKEAESDVFIFIQSDVFVHERTLNKLLEYLEEWDMAFPQQVPISRNDVLEISKVSDGTQTHIGGRDAGLIAITREAFERAGGWDGRFRNLLGEKAFFMRCDEAGVSWTDHTNAFITHIMAGSNLQKEEGLYNYEMSHDAQLIKEFYS